MIIAGGCYRELCESPHWDSLLGSGGRAALALASIDPTVELHTYFPAGLRHVLHEIEASGVRVHATPSQSEIVFAYFHPLSTPTIAPPLTCISHHAPLQVSGKVVLRFGLAEGDAVVNADRAVYDPQNPNSAPFRTNGSKANTLALVMNQRELFATGNSSDLHEAAQRITTFASSLLIATFGPRLSNSKSKSGFASQACSSLL